MISKTFEYVPEFGIHRIWHYDETNDTATIEERQDHTAIIEANKKEYNSVDERARYNDGMHHVARIPMVIMADLIKKGILGPGGRVIDKAAFKRFLNDPENRFFRTRPGQV